MFDNKVNNKNTKNTVITLYGKKTPNTKYKKKYYKYKKKYLDSRSRKSKIKK